MSRRVFFFLQLEQGCNFAIIEGRVEWGTGFPETWTDCQHGGTYMRSWAWHTVRSEIVGMLLVEGGYADCLGDARMIQFLPCPVISVKLVLLGAKAAFSTLCGMK